MVLIGRRPMVRLRVGGGIGQLAASSHGSALQVFFASWKRPASCTRTGTFELGDDDDAGIGQRRLLVGFAAALRRSELVALDVADVVARSEGLVVNIRRSKTDQEGAGRKVGVPYGSNPRTCPVRAVEA